MPAHIVMNNGDSLGKVLAANLETASLFQVATAYLNHRGLDRVIDPMQRILEQDGEVSVAHGFYPLITETETIRSLARLADSFDQMSYGVYADTERTLEGKFHPKLYLTYSPVDRWRAVIGSSNLTQGGLRANLEVNCTLSGSASTPEIQQCRDVFKKIQHDQNLHRPTVEWIEAYDEIRNLEIDSRERFRAETKDLYDKLFNITQVPPWVPKTREECVIQAVQNLERRDGRGSYHHLNEITPEAFKIADGRYQARFFSEGVRQALNTNEIHKYDGNQLFERQDGAEGNSGRYKLSARGRNYRGRS